jgi:hypothetical protein
MNFPFFSFQSGVVVKGEEDSHHPRQQQQQHTHTHTQTETYTYIKIKNCSYFIVMIAITFVLTVLLFSLFAEEGAE